MGMYTEIFFRAEVDAEVVAVINTLNDYGKTDWPDHEFFRCPRFRGIAHGGSYCFPQANHCFVEYDEHVKAFFVSFRANLKNYDDEIEKFFDWVSPHVGGEPGDFIGYSLYEEAETPTLHYKAGTA